jgi:HprK-related kinase A
MRIAARRRKSVSLIDLVSLSHVSVAEVRRALGGAGVWLDVGAAVLHVRSDSAAFAAQLCQTYPAFPLVTHGPWADLHVRIERASGPRRWLRPQVRISCDGQQPFDPFPASQPLPLFEWGCNWLLGQRLNDLLLLHAGAVERDGIALVLPATPGSGKSTLTAALSQRGWRLLSDEFGAYDLSADCFRAMLKPVALKNQSIDVLQRFAPHARLGPAFEKTRKGTVAHLAATPDAVARRHEAARPGAFVLPRWEAGATLRLEPLTDNRVFPALAFNAFNYAVLGAASFKSVMGLAQRCKAWQLIYSELDQAVAAIDGIWPEVLERSARGQR